MKSLRFFLVLILLAASFGVAAQEPSDLARILDAMAEGYYLPTIQAEYGTFTFEYTDLPTPFTRWLEDRLSEAAARSSHVKIHNSSAAAALDPAFKKIYGTFLTETGTEALLHGRFFSEGARIRVRLELTDLSTGTLVGASDWFIETSQVPSYAPVGPTTDALARAKELARLGFTIPEGLIVSVTTDRGAGAAYRDGERMEVIVTTNMDAYVRLYHVNGDGHIQMIWPNAFGGGDGLIRAGGAVRLPGSSDPFSFIMTAPYGTEFIKAVASTVPFTDKEQDFLDLGTNAKVLTRGLVVVGKKAPEAAEALASYYIGPAR